MEDGSYLSWIYPNGQLRKKGCQPRLVRVIEYTIEHPEKPEEQLTYRLITSLLEVEKFPAELLAREYHQRWSQLAIGGEGQASTTQIIHGAEQTTQTSLPLSPKPYLGEVENTIDELKIHLIGRKTHVRSQKPREVVQEVYGWLLGHWAVRVLIFQAATSASVPPLLLSFHWNITSHPSCPD